MCVESVRYVCGEGCKKCNVCMEMCVGCAEVYTRSL